MVEETTVSEITEVMLKEFGLFLLENRIPNMVDGLKTVHRRILTCIGEDTSKFDKVSQVGGRVMSIHPHGDGSINDAVTELTKSYTNVIPIVQAMGNNGSYTEPKGASAPRYLKAALSKFGYDCYIKAAIPKALKYKRTVADKGVEPINLVPIIPMTLLIRTLGIGVGCKADIIPKGFDEVCNLAKAYVRRQMSGNVSFKGLERYLLPDHPVGGVIVNGDMLIEAYKKGDYDASIMTTGTMDISPDSILIKHISMDNALIENTEKVFRSLKKLKDPIFKKIGIPESYADKKTSPRDGEVVIPLNRGVSPFEVMDYIKTKIKYRSKFTPTSLYVNGNNEGVYAQPPRLLHEWYTARRQVLAVELKYKQDTLLRNLRECEAVLIMKDHAKDITNRFITSKVWTDVIPYLKKTYGLTTFQTKYLSKYQMARLSLTERDSLVNRLDEIKSELETHRGTFVNIDELIITSIDKLQKDWKSAAPRQLKLPKYYGYIQFLDGVIRCWDEHELKLLSRKFKKVDHVCVVLNSKYPVEYGFGNSGLFHNSQTELDKEFPCTSYNTYSCTNVPDKGILLVDGTYSKRPISTATTDMVLVGNRIGCIDKNNKLIIRDYTTKKGLWRGDKFVCSDVSNEYVVVYAGVKKHKLNVVTLALGDKLVLPLIGDTKILYMGAAEKQPVFKVPVKYRGKNSPELYTLSNLEGVRGKVTMVDVRKL